MVRLPSAEGMRTCLRKNFINEGEKMLTYNIIADYFLALGNETQELITNLKLNKLVYYTQAWHLALFEQPIFEEDFQAWVHGPVLPSLYKDYTGFAFKPIIKEGLSLDTIKEDINPELQSLIDDITEIYFPKTAYELEQMTHNEDPWLIARGGLEQDVSSTNIITKDSIKDYYSKQLPQV